MDVTSRPHRVAQRSGRGQAAERRRERSRHTGREPLRTASPLPAPGGTPPPHAESPVLAACYLSPDEHQQIRRQTPALVRRKTHRRLILATEVRAARVGTPLRRPRQPRLKRGAAAVCPG